MTQKILALFLILALCLPGTAFAHPGRTDSEGGHHDNKDKSGLGSYHYHCDGHPAHLHENGVCPYAPKEGLSANVGDVIYMDGLSDAPDPEAEWFSANEGVAIVLNGGVILAVSEGKCEIFTEASGKKMERFPLSVKSGEFDLDAVRAQLPKGFEVRGKYGSAAISFAEECGLSCEIILPDGLPFGMGDQGEAVRDVQSQLIRLKYLSGKADGTYGKKTESALKAYYKAQNEIYDGEVDESDYRRMMTAPE